MGTEALLESPSDLEFWRSTDIGFLTKNGLSVFPLKEVNEELQYIVTDELVVLTSSMEDLLEQLRKIAEAARREPDVQTCWVLNREADEHSSRIGENEVYVLSRFRTRASYEIYKRTASRNEWDTVIQLAVKMRTTTWEEAGIGFLGK